LQHILRYKNIIGYDKNIRGLGKFWRNYNKADTLDFAVLVDSLIKNNLLIQGSIPFLDERLKNALDRYVDFSKNGDYVKARETAAIFLVSNQDDDYLSLNNYPKKEELLIKTKLFLKKFQ